MRYNPDGTPVTTFSVAIRQVVSKERVAGCPTGWQESLNGKNWELTTDPGLEAEGISVLALHHSSATWARAGGAKLDAIVGMLGHASVTTTSIYAQIVDKIAENPARYLEELMGLSWTKRA
jgi:integrase